MNILSDEEFEQIYGRKPVRRVKKKKIYWNRIIIALIILIGISASVHSSENLDVVG